MSKYDFGVFIGRFQPFHLGHKHVVDNALEQVDKLIIVIGGPGKRTLADPLTLDERQEIIEDSLSDEQLRKIQFAHVQDLMYMDDIWVRSVTMDVQSVVEKSGWSDKPKTVALVGMHKDESSYYLNLFPQWESVTVQPDDHTLSATSIREAMWKKLYSNAGLLMSPNGFRTFVETWDNQVVPALSKFKDDVEFYQQKYGNGPFITVDSIVTWNRTDCIDVDNFKPDKLLLVRRKDGKLALPGGFVEAEKGRLIDNAWRELQEETHISINRVVYDWCTYKDPHVFDAVRRDERARIITNGFVTHLYGWTLPDVRGDDDVIEAFWFDLSLFSVDIVNQFHADHWHIITKLLFTLHSNLRRNNV